MTTLLKLSLPLLAALIAINAYYFSLKVEAYNSYTESDNCQQFARIVAELGLKKAIGLEAFRNNEEDGHFLVRMAEWIGTEEAARDCVDVED
jgi:hypothetical protein